MAPESAPPPYEQIDTSTTDVFLDRIQSSVSRERDTSQCSHGEVERLRHFLLYCLCIDYRHGHTSSLSPEDSQHYLQMVKALRLLDAYHAADLNFSQRKEIGSYLWRYVHEPCKVLGIPAECAVVAVMRWEKFQNAFAGYKGCVFGLLHTFGPERLAQKLWLDVNVVIPRLLPDRLASNSMIFRVHEVSQIYCTHYPQLMSFLTYERMTSQFVF